jgi:hypothetical protein
MAYKLIQINADEYFDAATKEESFDQANAGTWDRKLGLRFILEHTYDNMLGFEIIDHKKYAIAKLKHGFNERIVRDAL